jgi:hypothetical protein
MPYLFFYLNKDYRPEDGFPASYTQFKQPSDQENLR